MLLTTEPANSYGHHSCGLCALWAQELVPVRDPETGQQLTDPETGQPVLENDQSVSSQEITDHVAVAHPDLADA